MNCHELDWKGFALDEITAPERRRMEEHLASCAACAEELESIRLTVTAMKRLPVLAVPRRIAFVSDPVFEPSWWERFWSSGPRLGFASAAMLSLAILAHGLVARPGVANPPPAPIVARQAVQPESKPVAQPLVPDQIRAQVMAEVSVKLAEQDKRAQARRAADLAEVKSAFDMMQKRMSVYNLTAFRSGGD